MTCVHSEQSLIMFHVLFMYFPALYFSTVPSRMSLHARVEHRLDFQGSSLFGVDNKFSFSLLHHVGKKSNRKLSYLT